MKLGKIIWIISLILHQGTSLAEKEKKLPKPQYHWENILIPPASEKEPFLRRFSVDRALAYLEEGATAWTRNRKCLSCHTNGTYMVTRPALTRTLGKPSNEIRRFFVQQLHEFRSIDLTELRSGIKPTQVAYVAQGLAEWDAHVTGILSGETENALALMLQVQGENGDWKNTDTWPPFESSNYQSTTVAALAMATAPKWLRARTNLAAVRKTRQYLRTHVPHDYGSLLLLWVGTRWPGLLEKEMKQKLIDMIWTHQREDGGWSIRTFVAPEKWGRGNRATKLRAEADFENPKSDGHQTGLCVLVLRQSGISSTDTRIQRAIHWLLNNQRQSGRWWTRSLNTDKFHFITYSGTCYPLMALDSCGQLALGSQIDSLKNEISR